MSTIEVNEKHHEHIIAVPGNLFGDRRHGFSQYQLKSADIIIAQRKFLENNDSYRQVLPMNMFVHNGKLWAYRRTESGGESNLHGKVALFAGGHWDLADIVMRTEPGKEGFIDLDASLNKAIKRELEEEVVLTSNVVSTTKLPIVVCADDVGVDRHHVAIVYIHELDGEGVASNEDQLEAIGFLSQEELLGGEYDLETWARLAVKIYAGDIPDFSKK